MYKCKHFKIEELVPEKTYKTHGDDSWNLFDERILKVIDKIRDYFGCSMVINNWASEGNMQFRGYRYPGCGVGTPTGAHYKGMAADFNLYKQGKLLDSEFVSKETIKNKAKFPEVKGVEVVNGWSHVDVMLRAGQKPGTICVFGTKGFLYWA